MNLIPAIDLRNGKCVRLQQGKPDREKIYSDSPERVAARFYEAGATKLHLVDLDGAILGKLENAAAVEQIVKDVPVKVELGGGIRSIEQISFWIEHGVDQVILGTIAVQNPELVAEAVETFGHRRIVVAMDVLNGYVASHGWQNVSDVLAKDFGREMVRAGVRRFIFTDIQTDGMLSGPNLEALIGFAETVRQPVTASGGVRNMGDILRIKESGCSYLDGVIVGKAIYEGQLSVREAIKLLNNNNR